jgi:hypothetical protein
MRKMVFGGLVALLAVGAMGAQAQTRTVTAHVVTGVNRFLGEPVLSLGAFGPIGFNDLGAYNSHGAEALPLTPDTPRDTLLASLVDPGFLAAFHVDPGTVDAKTLNIPLRDVGVYVAPDGTRAPVRDIFASSQMTPSRAHSSGPITLGKWLDAKGTATIHCTRHSATVKIEMTGLIERALYDVWGVMLTANGPAPICLGGSPCAFVTDERGQATFKTALNFCPYNLRSTEVPMGEIEVLYHADHSLYGFMPELFAAGYPPGIVSFSHLDFPVSGTPLN